MKKSEAIKEQLWFFLRADKQGTQQERIVEIPTFETAFSDLLFH